MPKAKAERSAGGIVYRLVGGVPHFLLIRDSYKNWGFPKGHVKRGEEDAAAAEREVREETGLDGLAMRGEAGTIAWSFRFRGARIDKTCRFFVMESAHGETHPQAEEGITACRWLPAAEAEAKLSHDNARDLLREVVTRLTKSGEAAARHGE